MSVNLSSRDKSKIFANHGLQQSSDGQYKNLDLNKLQNAQIQNYVQNSIVTQKTCKLSGETNYDSFNAERNSNSINKKCSNKMTDAKATKFSGFGEKPDHQKIQSKNDESENGSTLSLHIAAYENSNVKEIEGKFSSEKDKKNMVTKTWKTVKSFFESADTLNMFEIPRQQKEGNAEPEIMQFKASQQLLDPNNPKIPLMPMSNTEILEKGTERDGEKIVLSEKKLAEEVSFLCNNLSLSNLTDKVDDIRQILSKHDDTCRKWLAQYLVMKRITLEQNFHSLYNSFLIALNDEKLDDYVKQETFRNIKILLKSDKKLDASCWRLVKSVKESLGYFDDRQLLKNLGRWLGLITIGRDEPILMNQLNLKDLLLDASSKGEKELLYIVPFVVKIVESAAISDVFSPESAWILQLLHQLAAIYQQPNIKLAIKFEFEVLCQTLKVPLRCILPPYSYLPHENAASQEIFNSTVFSPKYTYNDINIYEGIDRYFDIPVEFPLFRVFPALSTYCRKAMADAVQENMEEMIKRAGAAAMFLTDDLIHKDFALCPDTVQMRKAYLYTVRSLTSAAGMVTSKEPLTTSIIGHLRRLIEHQLEMTGEIDPEFIRMADETMVHILEKNIELACCYVVKMACQKAIVETEKRMEEAILRRKNGPKLEISPETRAIINTLPPALRPVDETLDDYLFQVYTTFGAKIIGFKFTGFIEPTVDFPPPEPIREEPPIHQPILSTSQFRERSEIIFAEWMKYSAYWTYPLVQIVGPHLYGLMETHGIPVNDPCIIRFLKISLDICTNVSYDLLDKAGNNFPSLVYSRSHSCYTVDAFSKLASFFVRSGESDERKLQMLNNILEMITNTLLVDHDSKTEQFTGLPMLRIFTSLIKDFCRVRHWLFKPQEPFYGHFVESFGRALNEIQPRRAPAFAYHWLEIVGHRQVLASYLSPLYTSDITRAVYARLFLGLLKFLAPCFRNVDLSPPIQSLYIGTIRLMFLILHDFPEVFCEYYYVFCDVIPANCIQIRNIVLSAYPSNMKLPDPYNKSFEIVAATREMSTVAKLSSKMFTSIPETVRGQLDAFLENPADPKFLSDLISSLKPCDEPGNKYNAPCLNAAVYFIGLRAMSKIKENKDVVSKLSVATVPSMKAFQALIAAFCTEGRYLLFNALANQLRYPNAQTYYFTCTILYLFKEAANDSIREQITRCLYDRILAVRPHPWGLLYILREFFTNDEYKFWEYKFVRFDPEIERSFINVAKPWNVVITPKFPQESSEPKTKKAKKV